MTGKRTMYRGTIEYLTGTVIADAEITDADTIAVSLDNRVTWLTAEWMGVAGLTRSWRILLGDTNPLPDSSNQNVFVRVTDNPEAPVLNAGLLQIS